MENIIAWMKRYQGFGYATFSSTPSAPRARIILAANREMVPDESLAAGKSIQAKIITDLRLSDGQVKFDESVYRHEQPIYTPPKGKKAFRWPGPAFDVDEWIKNSPPSTAPGMKETKINRLREAAENDPVLQALEAAGLVKKNLGEGRYGVICPCAEEHTSDDASDTTTVYHLPHTGGFKYGKFVCLHDHCRDRDQAEFITALDLDPRSIWHVQVSDVGETSRHNFAGGRFEVSQEGVFFIGQKDGEDLPPKWVCSRLNIIAKTRDVQSGEWGRLLKWEDDDDVYHQWAMPNELLQGDGVEVRRELARLGLSIAPGKQARDMLTSYLQVWPVNDRARCVDRLGWHGGVYLTPNETIGAQEEHIVFQNIHATEPALSISGSVEDWRNSLGAMSRGNPRIMFAISTAFAAPLADIVNEDSGGFHLRGTSSSGKTTALNAAASVYGHPDKYRRQWRSTANGLEGLAALHNDGLLILDELSQIDPRDAGEAAYLLANGKGKTRASRTGTAKHAASWRLLVLSAGEESLAALMSRVGKRANAGQEVRLADIDADAGAGMGIFQELNGHPTPAALAVTFKESTIRHHGAIGKEWLNRVVAERETLALQIPKVINQLVADMVQKDSMGQVLRVARRFALVAVAGELATQYGLTGWAKGEATIAARECFQTWLESFGSTGNREERALLAQVRGFFEAHACSRFEALTGTAEQRIINRVGFVRTNEFGEREYLVLPEVFGREVCQGFDKKFAEKVLVKEGWVIPGNDGRPTQKPRIPELGTPRCYVFSSKMWDSE
jgi:uncharacterized protein (DUF927 family)